jgi:hypothetical protein
MVLLWEPVFVHNLPDGDWVSFYDLPEWPFGAGHGEGEVEPSVFINVFLH